MTRFLTEEEISQVLNFIQPLKSLDPDVAEQLRKNQYEGFAVQIRQNKLNPTKISELSRILEKSYFSSIVVPGKFIGAQSSSCTSEQIIQQSLSSFHKAGQNK